MKIPGVVDFSKAIREWDGFGVNYVETCQTYDTEKNPQDYGGFSTLSKEAKKEIIKLIFGEDGLKPSIAKMFLDPLHQMQEPSSVANSTESIVDLELYDHESTTKYMREFINEGINETCKNGRSLSIYSALYGPPRWMTKQKVWRSRDLDYKYKYEICRYMVSWVKYLQENGYPIKYMGLHNEGEDFYRWDDAGYTRDNEKGHDYNLYWNPDSVSEFLPILKKMLERNNLNSITPTPGETTNWGRFSEWGYADAIADNPEAVEAIGLITSHGFFNGTLGAPFFGDHRSAGIDVIREKKKNLHAWSTSTSWSKMDSVFLMELKNQIYAAKVNGIIPWACIQNHSLWVNGDPNPGCAITVDGKGNYTIQKGYWYYKQLSTIGQAGTNVVSSSLECSFAGIAAFSSKNEKAFCLINCSAEEKEFSIRIIGLEGSSRLAEITRTSQEENCVSISSSEIIEREESDNMILELKAKANSATTIIFK